MRSALSRLRDVLRLVGISNQNSGDEPMAENPVDLDQHRGRAAQIATDLRRQRLYEFQVDQAALQRRQEELEELLMADPAETWAEAAAKAQYLIQLYAETSSAQDPRRQKLIEHALSDISRLCDRARSHS